jgi:hypothetical protein
VVEKQSALVLPKGAAASSEPQTFGGIPGIYAPGEPVFLSDTGISKEHAQEISEDERNPLELTEAAPPRGKPLADLDRGELSEIAAEHQIEVERADGEGEPVKSDYLRVLVAAGIETTSPDELPVAGHHYDTDSLEPGEAVPPLAPAGQIASALEGHWPDGSPMLPEAEEATE